MFSAEDTKLNKLSLKRFLQNLVLFQVGNRSFYCRPGTSDFKSASEAQSSYSFLVRNLPPGPVCVVDAGANIGGFSAWCADALGDREDKQRYFAYEPVKEHYELAKRNIMFNGLSHKIRLHMSALDRVSGNDVMRRPKKYSQNYRDSLVASVTEDYTEEAIRKLDVRSEFDVWTASLRSGYLLVKVDVEGYERIVVQRLVQTYRARKRAFQLKVVLEYSHDMLPLFSEFRAFIDFLKSKNAEDLTYNQAFYKSRGSFESKCANSASIIKFCMA